jgi:DNA-directed RNA polymerase beta subunit
MNLIQILLPLCNNQGRMFKASKYKKVKATLASRFQGLTAYSRVAAEGLWRVGKSVKRDDIVVYEVMTKSFNQKWWKKYRRALEAIFEQESIVIRVQKIEVL